MESIRAQTHNIFYSINLFYSILFYSILFEKALFLWRAVAYPGILFGGVQQIQLRTERTGIWGQGFWRQL